MIKLYSLIINNVLNYKEKELRHCLDLNGPRLSKRWTRNTNSFQRRPTSGPSWVRFPEPYLGRLPTINE